MERQQLSRLSPADATVALRSYARRFGELFPDSSDLDTSALIVPGPSGWSVASLLRTTEGHLRDIDEAIRTTLTCDEPELRAPLLDRPKPPDNAEPGPSRSILEALERLVALLTIMAERISRTPVSDWARKATVVGRPSDAHELLREAVAFGRTSLDDMVLALAHARRTPS